MLVRSAAVLSVLLWLPALQAASLDPLENWANWRGPHFNGSATRANPPLKWDTKTNVKWKVAVPGKGSSTPIVWGDQVFIVTAVDTGRKAAEADIPKGDPKFPKKTNAPQTYHQFIVLAFDRNTGKELWRRVAAEAVPHEGCHPTHSYAAGSPSTDGERLYVTFGSQGIYCYDLSGKLLWKRDLGRMHTRLGWGEGASPTLHGDFLVVPWDHEGPSFVVGLDKRTGDIRWKVDRDEPTCWSTPLVVEYKGQAQVILNAKNRVRSYDLATGKLIWECGGQTLNAIPCPIQVGDTVVCMSGYRGAVAMAIPLDARGDITESKKIIWQHDRGTPYVPSAVLLGDRLYFTQRNEAQITCLEARTGKVIIDHARIPGLRTIYASPLGVAGRLYIADRDGTTVVLEAGDKVKVLATNKLDEAIDASPVAVGKQLFLRGEKHLYCIEESGSGK